MAEEMSREELATLMAAMSHDERVDFYKALDPRAQEALCPASPRPSARTCAGSPPTPRARSARS